MIVEKYRMRIVTSLGRCSRWIITICSTIQSCQLFC